MSYWDNVAGSTETLVNTAVIEELAAKPIVVPTVPTAKVTTSPILTSKINWSTYISAASTIMLLTVGHGIDPEIQLQLGTGIAAIHMAATFVLRTWFNK